MPEEEQDQGDDDVEASDDEQEAIRGVLLFGGLDIIVISPEFDFRGIVPEKRCETIYAITEHGESA